MATKAFQKIYTKISQITKATCSLKATGVGYDELAMVNGKLAQVVKIAGDEVTLIGKDGKEFISIEKFGDLSGRFSYEFACDISKRVPRVYIKDGREWGDLTFFE